jgi:hypothetical protein
VIVSLPVGSVQRCEPSDSANSVSTHTPADWPTRRRDSAIHTWSRPPAKGSGVT